MIAVSIAMAVWTGGLQIAQRRSTRKRIESTEEGTASETTKQDIVNEKTGI